MDGHGRSLMDECVSVSSCVSMQCHTYTETELDELWPWQSEQATTSAAVDEINALMGDLASNWTVIGGDAVLLSYLTTNTSNMACVYTGDSGVIGYSGLLKCSTLNRFVHQMVSGYCVDFFDPLYTLAVCLIILAVIIIVANWIEVALRREVTDYKAVQPDFELKSIGG